MSRQLMRILRRGETGLNIIRNIDVCYYLLAEYQQSLQANDFRAGADYITSKLLKKVLDAVSKEVLVILYY